MERRRMMMQSGGGAYTWMDYEQYGLICLFDGVDKGNEDGVWTDVIGGIRAIPDGDAIFADNYVNPNGYQLPFDSIPNPMPSIYTLEVCFYRETGKGGVVAFNSSYNSRTPKLGCWGNLHTFLPSSYKGFVIQNVPNFITISMDSNDGIILNLGIPQDTYYGGYQTAGSGIGIQSFLGNNSLPMYFKCYSIRLYNRILSIDEKLKNQQIDIARFNN